MAKNTFVNKFHLRPYKPSDSHGLTNLWYRTWHNTYPDLTHPSPLSEWRNRLDKEIIPTSTTYILETLDERIVGFMCVVIEQNYLSQLFIDDSYQGQGLGSLLINEAKKLCPEKLSLHTLERNLQSRKFYTKHGFVEGEKSVNLNNGCVNIWYHWLASDRTKTEEY